MNRFLKLFMLVLIFGVLVGAVFAVGAFAEDEKATTVTYKIPEDNTDTFLLFDAKTGDFIRSAPDLIADSAYVVDGVAKNDYILDYDNHNKFVNKVSESYYILMQKDYEVTKMWKKLTDGTYSQTGTLNNFFHLASNFVLDLNGHTMTFSTTIGAPTKGTEGALLNFTFKNGTIVNNGTQVISFKADSKNRTCNLTFDNITFTVAEGKKPTYWVQSNAKNSDSTKQLNTEITYKNCTFDTTNLQQNIYVSALGVSSNNITNNVEFIDCGLTVKEKYFRPTTTNAAEGGSVTFTGTTDDSLTTPYGILPTYASVADYPFVLFDPSKNTVLWAGTKWGGETKTDGEVDGLMYAIFNNRTKNTIAYLRRDFETKSKSDTAYYNHGNISGTHVIDLGNHTIKAPYDTILFYEQLKKKTDDLFITVKNGTFDLANKAELMELFGGNYCHNQDKVSDYMYDPDTHTIYKSSSIPDAVKENTENDEEVYYYTSNVEKNMTYLFENVKFKNLGAEKYLIYEGRSSVKLTANIRFKNCDIEYSGARTAPLFYYGQSGDSTVKGFYKTSNSAFNTDYNDSAEKESDKYIHPAVMKTSVDYEVDIILEGGSITNNSGTSVLTALTTVPKYHADKKSITLEKGENGKYTTYTTQSSVNVDSAEYTTAGGTYYLRQTAEAGTTKTYVFSKHGFISTYLNLESDLNMVYRVFLPANANATVTFTVGEFENVVTSTETDENGLYLFKLPAINAALMGETITATLATEDESVSGTLEYTIKAYLEAVKKQYSDEATQNLVEALLVYGAAAEQYTGIDAEVGELDPVPDEKEYTVVKTGTAISQFAMNIGGTFFLRVAIDLPEDTDMTNMELVATKGGKDKTYDLLGYTPGKRIVITYDEITALELDEKVTFVLMNGEEEISSIEFSANSYLFRAEAYAQTNPTLVALTRAIYWYGVAAEAYQEVKSK